MTETSWFTLPGNASVLFPFITAKGVPQPARPTADRVVRAGVNGIGRWQTGTRGEAFAIKTACDYASQALAWSALASYFAKIDDTLDLYWQGELWGECWIQNVTSPGVNVFTSSSGGINVADGASGTLLVANWQLETLYQ